MVLNLNVIMYKIKTNVPPADVVLWLISIIFVIRPINIVINCNCVSCLFNKTGYMWWPVNGLY